MKKTLFTSLICVALFSTATAELIDLTSDTTLSNVGSDVARKAQNTNNALKFSASEILWRIKPRMKINAEPCFCTASGEPSKACYKKWWSVTARLYINKQGDINSVKIVKSDASSRMERSIIRSLRQSKLAPVKYNGQPVSGYFDQPIQILNDEYNPNLQCPVLSSDNN